MAYLFHEDMLLFHHHLEFCALPFYLFIYISSSPSSMLANIYTRHYRKVLNQENLPSLVKTKNYNKEDIKNLKKIQKIKNKSYSKTYEPPS